MYNTKKLKKLDNNATIKNIKKLFNKKVKIKIVEKYEFLGENWATFVVLYKKNKIYTITVNNKNFNIIKKEKNKKDFLRELNTIVKISNKCVKNIDNIPAYKMLSAILSF